MDYEGEIRFLYQRIDKLHKFVEKVDRVLDAIEDYKGIIENDREQLLDALREITEAHRNACGRSAIVTKAERAIADVDASLSEYRLPRDLEIAQTDRWIDATGTKPPIDFEPRRPWPPTKPSKPATP
jgi:hypothetical protein